MLDNYKKDPEPLIGFYKAGIKHDEKATLNLIILTKGGVIIHWLVDPKSKVGLLKKNCLIFPLHHKEYVDLVFKETGEPLDCDKTFEELNIKMNTRIYTEFKRLYLTRDNIEHRFLSY